MMNDQTLAPHESLELHEALNFKTLCLAKSMAVTVCATSEIKAVLIK
jgi:similar to spore coat protein